MLVIVAGSRSVGRLHRTPEADDLVTAAMTAAAAAGVVPSAVLCGLAGGIDMAGKRWADARGIAVLPFPAAWDDLDAPGAVIRYRQAPAGDRRGAPYNARAGNDRNVRMVACAAGGALVAVWNGRSAGTYDVIRLALGRGLRVLAYATAAGPAGAAVPIDPRSGRPLPAAATAGAVGQRQGWLFGDVGGDEDEVHRIGGLP